MVWDGKALSNPPPPPVDHTAEQKAAGVQALNNAQDVALNCLMAGKAFPADWRAYVASLKGVRDNGGELPTARLNRRVSDACDPPRQQRLPAAEQSAADRAQHGL